MTRVRITALDNYDLGEERVTEPTTERRFTRIRLDSGNFTYHTPNEFEQILIEGH